ncbi:Glycosyl transferase family 2 [Gracilimonas mengyeensis]|uniref:Glycosyl transferase family 2 n=2 Tax=Gracilimonas mengyeensis TaxID=1302730 RepID=A0A521FKI5_9BACT|nr:glycosyltransferase [Gracilimonas mengyeensis]SMO96713.1 Glycosyl transferase family 2 [Gracilimonas mengyeensis]
MDLAPVIIFCYNRLNETQQTIQALKENYLSEKSILFIFSDGPKKFKDHAKVKEVREFLQTVEGFKSIEIVKSKENNGLAQSIISGVSQVIEEYGKVIVLEDDLITSPNFLDFMNQALDFHQDSEDIFSISGYTMDLPSLKDYPKDYYVGYRASSWGWGTWREQWEKVDWEVSNYSGFKWNLAEQLKFMRGGSDLPRMLSKQMNGKIDSWAVRWCYDQFKRDMYTVFPSTSKVVSIGFGEDATHTKDTNRFDTILDQGEQRDFEFEAETKIDKILAKEFRKKFSFKNRLLEKITL